MADQTYGILLMERAAERPADPPDKSQVRVHPDTGQLYIVDDWRQWHDIGLFRYTQIKSSLMLPAAVQILYAEAVEITGEFVLDGGSVFII